VTPTRNASGNKGALLSKTAWGSCMAGGLGLLIAGLSQTFYFVAGSDAFSRNQAGSALILSGSLLTLAVAAWSYAAHKPLWVPVCAAVPAVVIGGLSVLFPDSLFPHIGALIAIPAGLVGLAGGLFSAGSRSRR
jgi:hypothetical protein